MGASPDRLSRRHQLLHLKREKTFHAEQISLEQSSRSRSARRVRLRLRQMQPIVLETPRWSCPQSFLEDLALELAIAEPTILCRTVSFRAMKGRPRNEVWRLVLSAMAQLSAARWTETQVPYVASTVGFRRTAIELLLKAQDENQGQVALLAHGAEWVPREVIQALSDAWGLYEQKVPTGRKATLLLAGASGARHLRIADAPQLSLEDFGPLEATQAFYSQFRETPPDQLDSAVHFSGGIPAVIDAMSAGMRRLGGVPHSNSGLLRCLGELQHEIRGAVDIASSDPALAGRIEALCEEALPYHPETDDRLCLAGLVHRLRRPGGDQTGLRAPLLGALLSGG